MKIPVIHKTQGGITIAGKFSNEKMEKSSERKVSRAKKKKGKVLEKMIDWKRRLYWWNCEKQSGCGENDGEMWIIDNIGENDIRGREKWEKKGERGRKKIFGDELK